jgi:hypothetical protein
MKSPILSYNALALGISARNYLSSPADDFGDAPVLLSGNLLHIAVERFR